MERRWRSIAAAPFSPIHLISYPAAGGQGPHRVPVVAPVPQAQRVVRALGSLGARPMNGIFLQLGAPIHSQDRKSQFKSFLGEI
jgi:hypothetical protein